MRRFAIQPLSWTIVAALCIAAALTAAPKSQAQENVPERAHYTLPPPADAAEALRLSSINMTANRR